MLDKILDFIFPETCVYCGKIGNIICKECLRKINYKYLFKKIKNEYFDYLYCSSFYKTDIKKKIHKFKFKENSYLYKFFIEESLKNKEIYESLKKFDLITFVPMTKYKEKLRGYNQSYLLAKELGKRLEIEDKELLIKSKENKRQGSLSEIQRQENVKNVFEFDKSFNIKGKNIILVDDIITTGATIRSCSKALKDNGAGKILAFAIAKTEYKNIYDKKA